MSTKFLIVVLGPTAIGKTRLGIDLAKHFKAQIISADSRQFYKEMHVGTAVPSQEELSSVPHHFIQHKSIFETYTVGDFEREVTAKIAKLHQTNKVVVLVGGSGLYIDAVLKGLDHFPEVNPSIREKLITKFKEEGIEALQGQLKMMDPSYYKNVDQKNPHRLIRALEVCVASGKPYSSFLKGNEQMRDFTPIKIGLIAPRDVLYQRINLRVDNMITEGLLQEARSLFPNRELNALQTVGYRELFQHFKGSISLELAIEEVKKNTRRFAKRQLTWFRKQQNIHWFEYDEPTQKIIATIEKMV